MSNTLMKQKLLVIPDAHGRTFWKKPCQDIEKCDKVIFLGDYLDPYSFEDITVEDAIANFKEIIDFKKENNDKVVLLLGNHDMPYAFTEYYRFSFYHCRHSSVHHDEIAKLFTENASLFNICFTYGGIIFTHAGIEDGWLENVVKYKGDDIDEICDTLNSLTDTQKGLSALFCISGQRGGRDRYPSCIWADVHDMLWEWEYVKSPENDIRPIHGYKQVFGHTLQAYYDKGGGIAYGDAREFGNYKMLDNCKAYELDVDNFTVKPIV